MVGCVGREVWFAEMMGKARGYGSGFGGGERRPARNQGAQRRRAKADAPPSGGFLANHGAPFKVPRMRQG